MSIGFAIALVFVTGISAGAAQEGGVKAKEAEVASAQDRLMDIRMETSAAQASYNNALYEMNQLNGQIAQATEDLDAAKKRLTEAQNDLEERASQVYKSGNVAFMDVLVGVDDFSEFATRLDLWVRLLGEERAKVEAVEQAKDELAARKNALEEQRTQRVDAVDEAIAQKERAEEAEKEAEEYLGSLNADLREALQNKQDRQAEAALAAAEEFKAQETKPAPAPQPAPDEPTPIPEVQVAEIKQVPVEQPDLQDEQAAADRAAAAEAAAREAERLAEQRAAERQAAREAAEQAAAEQAAAEDAAAREARQDARAAAEREAELAAQRAAERQEARAAAEREAELAAQRAAAERAAAQQAADEREAARLAAQRRAERQEERQAAAEASASAAAAEEAQAAEEASASASAAAQEETTGNRPPRETTGSASASASASAAPVGGGGASGSGTSVIAEGQQYLGTPYVLGGAESCVPYDMMDCSCFTMTVYSAFGIALPDSPGGQMGYGTPVSGAPMAGDLLFWSEDGSGVITHVGIAMGDGTAIHASTYTGNVTQGTPIDSIPGYAGARRVL